MRGGGTRIACIAYGGWYPRGAARLIQSMHDKSPGFEVLAWVNVLPPGAPGKVIESDYDYTGYVAKPFAMLHMLNTDADIGIVCDASFYALREIHPLVQHISMEGYYLCKNGNLAGEWVSDRSLNYLGIDRRKALEIEEASSYCVGLNFHHEKCRELARAWADSWRAIPGPHTNTMASDGHIGRNPGFCSAHPRVRGHRHDQTTLSILAWELGMRDLTERPKFTAYLGSETEETVLVNRGMGS